MPTVHNIKFIHGPSINVEPNNLAGIDGFGSYYNVDVVGLLCSSSVNSISSIGTSSLIKFGGQDFIMTSCSHIVDNDIQQFEVSLQAMMSYDSLNYFMKNYYIDVVSPARSVKPEPEPELEPEEILTFDDAISCLEL